MVGHDRRRLEMRFGIAILFLLLGWALVPTRTGTPSNPHAMMIRTSIAIFREEHGKAPERLQEIKPILDRLAGEDCQITNSPDGRYLVVIPRDHRSPVRIEAEFSSSGNEVQYNANVLD